MAETGKAGRNLTLRFSLEVNHQLRELIEDSTSIQYRLELYRAGYEDNTHASQPPIATRREQLKEYQAAWLNGVTHGCRQALITAKTQVIFRLST